MSMTPSDNWYTNNVDKIIEIVGDAETTEFNQLDFDRVERELFSRAYDEIFKQLAQVEKENELLKKSKASLDLGIRPFLAVGIATNGIDVGEADYCFRNSEWMRYSDLEKRAMFETTREALSFMERVVMKDFECEAKIKEGL